MTRRRGESARGVEWTPSGKFRVRIAMTNEVGGNSRAYIGTGESFKEGVKIRNVAEGCRDIGRELGNPVTIDEIRKILTITKDLLS